MSRIPVPSPHHRTNSSGTGPSPIPFPLERATSPLPHSTSNHTSMSSPSPSPYQNADFRRKQSKKDEVCHKDVPSAKLQHRYILWIMIFSYIVIFSACRVILLVDRFLDFQRLYAERLSQNLLESGPYLPLMALPVTAGAPKLQPLKEPSLPSSLAQLSQYQRVSRSLKLVSYALRSGPTAFWSSMTTKD